MAEIWMKEKNTHEMSDEKIIIDEKTRFTVKISTNLMRPKIYIIQIDTIDSILYNNTDKIYFINEKVVAKIKAVLRLRFEIVSIPNSNPNYWF